MGDLLSDMIARIKNSQKRRRLSVEVMNTRYCRAVLECLLEEGYIRGYKEEGKHMVVYLKYKGGNPVLKECSRISRPGLRSYYSAKELRELYMKNELVIFTSNKGVVMNSSAERKGITEGGEALLRIR